MKTGGRFGQLRAMRGGYTAERTMYVQSGKKQNPVSGSYMHEVMEMRHNDFSGRSFSQLTANDFNAVPSRSVPEP